MGDNAEPARGSVRMSEDAVWTFVRETHTAILVRLRHDGMPIALPVWFVALDRRIYFLTGKEARSDPPRRPGIGARRVHPGSTRAELGQQPVGARRMNRNGHRRSPKGCESAPAQCRVSLVGTARLIATAR
jgi:hypothetical protein